MKVELMLYIYLFVCAAMIVFNIVTALLFRAGEQKAEKVSKSLRFRVLSQLKQIENNAAVAEKHKLYLSRKLRKVGNMAAFDQMLQAEYLTHPKEIRRYLRELDQVFLSLMAYYTRQNRMEAAYFPYIIKKYRVIAYRVFPSLEGALLNMLNEPSIYCRENAMQALYTTGDADCILKAVEIIDQSDLFFHSKLLCDGLLNFAGSPQALGQKITAQFFSFSAEMQVTLLDYLRFSGGEYREFALTLLQNNRLNDEIRYAAIRYFGKYQFWAAYSTLCGLAAESAEQKWQYAAIASTALSTYPGQDTLQILKQNLYSRNWYIRLNSAVSLKKLGCTYLQLTDIIDGNDRYAAEIIRYCLQREDAQKKGVAHA